MNNFYMVV